MNSQEVDQNFVCLVCTEVASNAVETLCCGQIMCENCVDDLKAKNHINCPNCRERMEVKISVLARRIISTIKMACDLCQDKVAHKDLKSHKRKCPKKIINCKECLKQIKMSHLVEHMKEEHRQKLFDLCLQYQVGPEEPSLSLKTQSCIQMVESKIKSSKGKNIHLGTSGKYYCGERALIGKCACCDGRCGPTNGENCDDCMEADVKRFNLQKGYLVNPIGVVCKLDREAGLYYCGKMLQGNVFCNPKQCCADCRRVSNSIRLGRYQKLI